MKKLIITAAPNSVSFTYAITKELNKKIQILK